MEIKVIDAPMGTGKTTAMFRHIAEHPGDKYIFVTPYLTEVERAGEACGLSKAFKRPSKSVSLKHLIEHGKSATITHALYMLMDDEVLACAKRQHYKLVIDETVDMVAEESISPFDWKILSEYVSVDSDGVCSLTPKAKSYYGAFEPTLAAIRNSSKTICVSGNMLFYLSPQNLLDSFDEVYILTYMFESSKMAADLRLYGFQWTYMYVTQDFGFTTEQQQYDISHYRDLINILEAPRHNEIGDEPTAFSHAWCMRNLSKVRQAEAKACSYVRSLKKSYNEVLWTTYIDVAKKAPYRQLSSKNFVPLNIRATNEYRNRSVIAYLCNRYMNPFLSRWYKKNGVPVDEDAFALSEMLQFLFRSCIRDGKPVWLYIPSKRMRNLLKGWLGS